ncbi:MAG: hypothetical protein HC917_06350 [Richelia sp. SM2_1_7]|nr:hypothetical protein [Richelia sp. SM2_1_7]
MGYRSSGLITLAISGVEPSIDNMLGSFSCKNRLLAIELIKSKGIDTKDYENLNYAINILDEVNIEDEKRVIINDRTIYYEYQFSYIKFYEDYNDIKKIRKLISYMDENEVSYIFIRMGEEYDDVEELGDTSMAYVSRSITKIYE